MRSIEELKEQIISKHVTDLEQSIMDKINGKMDNDNKYIYYTVMKTNKTIKEIGTEVLVQICNAGYAITTDCDDERQTRYKIPVIS